MCSYPVIPLLLITIWSLVKSITLLVLLVVIQTFIQLLGLFLCLVSKQLFSIIFKDFRFQIRILESLRPSNCDAFPLCVCPLICCSHCFQHLLSTKSNRFLLFCLQLPYDLFFGAVVSPLWSALVAALSTGTLGFQVERTQQRDQNLCSTE